MKSYKEITQNLLERREQYIEEQNRRRKRIIRVVELCGCISVMFLIGFGVWNTQKLDSKPQVGVGNTDIEGENNSVGEIISDNEQDEGSSSGSDNPISEYQDFTVLSFEEWVVAANVVWKEGTPIKGNTSTGLTIALGNTMITDELAKEFERNSDDTVYAIMVDFTPMCSSDLVFEGKTLSEWNAEKESLIEQGFHAEAKGIVQKINTAKEAFYFEQIEVFKDKFAKMGLGVYHEKYGCTIDNCIFYTFGTRSQIEEFKCDSDEAFIFSIAVRFK